MAVPGRRSTPLGPDPWVRQVVGFDLDGRPATVALSGTAGRTLLLFLSGDCDGCRPLWEAAGDPGRWTLATGDRVVAVTRDRRGAGQDKGWDNGDDKGEDLEALGRLAPNGSQVVLSSAAWADYGVSGPPFFVLVDGRSQRVLTEGVAWAVEQVAAHVADALAGSPRLAGDRGH